LFLTSLSHVCSSDALTRLLQRKFVSSFVVFILCCCIRCFSLTLF
jgi:hypothetical protein